MSKDQVAAHHASLESHVMYVELRGALGRAAMQAYVLLNGAAAATLLGFLGNLASLPLVNTRLIADLALLKIALAAFTIGVALAASTYAVAFVTLTLHISGRSAESERARNVAVGMNVFALGLFIVGIVISSRAITLR